MIFGYARTTCGTVVKIGYLPLSLNDSWGGGTEGKGKRGREEEEGKLQRGKQIWRQLEKKVAGGRMEMKSMRMSLTEMAAMDIVVAEIQRGLGYCGGGDRSGGGVYVNDRSVDNSEASNYGR